MTQDQNREQAQALYEQGVKEIGFDYEDGLARLMGLGDPEHVFRAGRVWPRFDFVLGFEALARLKSAKYIYHAGLEWKVFDHKKGTCVLAALADPQYLFYAGAHWKQFDFENGLEALLKTGACRYLYQAGVLWKSFDHARAWAVLESQVAQGEEWRGQAFEHPRWKKALLNIWLGLNFQQSPIK